MPGVNRFAAFYLDLHDGPPEDYRLFDARDAAIDYQVECHNVGMDPAHPPWTRDDLDWRPHAPGVAVFSVGNGVCSFIVELTPAEQRDPATAIRRKINRVAAAP